MDKVQIKAYIPSGLNDRFRRFISEKSRKYVGHNVSEYLQRAIQLFLDSQDCQYTIAHNPITNNGNGYPEEVLTPINNWKMVADYLTESGEIDALPKGRKLSEALLEKGIGHFRIDKRTIRNWKKSFVDNNIIAKSGPHQYQVLYTEESEFTPPTIEAKERGI